MNKISQPEVASSKPSNWLLQHQKSVTSQLGEDGILEKIFEVIPTANPWCVEFGASDGVTFSNTHHLINYQGWSSVQIEADPKSYELLASRYASKDKVICLNRVVSFEGENTLDRVLQATPIPINFDFLSIDIDGNDYYIWESLKVYRPKVVVIEFNPSIPHHISHVQPKALEIYQGSSLLALQQLGKQKGYELVASTEWNGFFVDSEYFPLFEIQDNSIWQMNQNYQFWTHVFQLYDGTVVVGGNNRLFWHNIEVDLPSIQETIQVLPPEEIGYPGSLSVYKSHHHHTVLSDLQNDLQAKESQIKLLANIAEERALSMSQKEAEIMLLTGVAQERQVALLEKEAQIQLLAIEVERLKHLEDGLSNP